MPRSGPSRDARVRTPAASRREGHEDCGFCLQTYELAFERHCVRCDRPICPFCIDAVAVRAVLVCPECAGECDAGAEEEDA